MSRIFKASSVKIDLDNAVNIDIMDTSQFLAVRQTVEQFVEEAGNGEQADTEQTAEQILERAKQEEKNILDNARREAEKIEADAKTRADKEANALFETSKEEGYRQGYENGLNETEEFKRQAQQVYEDALVQKEELLTAVEGEVVRLIIDILDKLLGDVVIMNPLVILTLVRQGLSGSTLNGEIKIHVSGQDYETVLKNRDEILPLVDGSATLEFQKDLSLNQGDCIIDTPFGNIDSSLSRQYLALKQDLHYLLKSTAGDAFERN